MFAYPFQLSGGMQQRVMIAMAMMLEPSLIIADEPTTALDVTIQARIFSLIKEMRQEKTSILLITHDMGVIWEMCDRVVVMYASRIAEEAGKKDIFEKPAHPYTRGLLNSIPKLTAGSGRLEAIPGQVPSPFSYPSGCHFRDRCPHAFDKCAEENPPLKELGNGHRSACWIAEKLIHQGDTVG
jgi:peptide/nickel transport system ATP-binding protein/oligopeptide transport system ATP-binding protein